jgi:hypothetical protein
MGTTYTDTGLATHTLYEYVVIARRNPDSVASKRAQATTTESNLTVYRPQWVKNFDNPEQGAFYDRLGRWPVLDEQELSVTEGPGIRINADDDNQNGLQDRGETSAIPQENNLIEVKIDRVPGSGIHSFSIGGQLQVFRNANRTQQMLSGDSINFNGDTATVFVEWVSGNHGTALLTLNEGTTARDTVRFHSFRSIVIVFGGNTQNPYDSDGDGSMGDPIPEGPFSPEGNREGMFDFAQNLYLTGWDVMAFGEEELIDESVETSIAYQEVTNALDRRFVGAAFDGGFSIMGYSQGGGATYELVRGIYERNETPDNVTSFAVYVDAVDHDVTDPNGFAPETRPPVAAWTLNLYQTHGLPRGNPIDEPYLGDVEEYDVTQTPGFEDVGHAEIDDEFTFHSLMSDRLIFYLDNR